MANLPAYLFLLLIFLLASLAEANNPRTVTNIYLVRMKLGSHGYVSRPGHHALLSEVLDEERAVADAHIYSYTESFTGFAARLTETERQKLERRREVLSVSPSRDFVLHTTRSWDFVNLPLKGTRRADKESDMVVAVLDTGIWPHSEVFNDKGMSPAPPGWDNKCNDKICNKKIIGARSYYTGKWPLAEKKSVIDLNGHGTHVASIVAGRETEDASFYGLAKGTLRGGVPNARIAVYKICWKVYKSENPTTPPVSECPEHDTLAAIDDAIKDKVDMISYSQGSTYPIPLLEDNVAWAFLKATGKGIMTSASAGNNGLSGSYTVTNGAPWILTVAASYTDRKFKTLLELQGGKRITSMNTINPFDTQKSLYPLVEETFDRSARRCELIQFREGPAFSDHMNDEGKDVFFNLLNPRQVEKLLEEKAKGLIINATNMGQKCQFPLPCVCLNEKQASTLHKYVKEYSKHLVKIHKTKDSIAPSHNGPRTAALSSMGPNRDKILENVLKPDIAAPGVDILAGWSKEAKLNPGFPEDNRVLDFNIMTGTSMACPHATAVALYLKSFNPGWSPAAIKSALMTTSTYMNRTLSGNEFRYGAGNLNATNVLNPGLVYDSQPDDYKDFLCMQGYNIERLKSHFGNKTIDCSKKNRTTDQLGDYINYPTMSTNVKINTPFKLVFYRTVTNVGCVSCIYNVEKNVSKGFKVIVEPETLRFSYLNEKKQFTVTVIGRSTPMSETSENFLMPETWITWSDGKHFVRSPIVVYSIHKEYEG